MKYRVLSIRGFLFFLLTLILYTNPSIPVAEGHVVGQPPYFKINGQYANLYPVPVSSLNDFNLPQDLAPANYSVNQTLNFELDKTRLPAPQEIVAKTKFTWNFGDGGSGLGLVESHSYTKMGSYFLDIYVNDGTTPKPQLLEKVLVNVLPDQNYKLPVSKILVNGKESKDPLTDILSFKFGESLNFETNSDDAFWDFGDQRSSSGKSVTHPYPKDLTQVFVVLRVKNSDGFIADNFVEIQNADITGQSALTNLGKPISQPQKSSPSQLKYTLIGLAILAGGILGVRKFLKR